LAAPAKRRGAVEQVTSRQRGLGVGYFHQVRERRECLAQLELGLGQTGQQPRAVGAAELGRRRGDRFDLAARADIMADPKKGVEAALLFRIDDRTDRRQPLIQFAEPGLEVADLPIGGG